ncbi:RING finger protein 113A [Camponotus japonicus]
MIIVQMKMIKSMKVTVVRKTCHVNVSFVETVLRIPLSQDVNIIFVKNVLWDNIKKVHDVIFVTLKLMALLILQKKSLHELKWRKRKKIITASEASNED